MQFQLQIIKSGKSKHLFQEDSVMKALKYLRSNFDFRYSKNCCKNWIYPTSKKGEFADSWIWRSNISLNALLLACCFGRDSGLRNLRFACSIAVAGTVSNGGFLANSQSKLAPTTYKEPTLEPVTQLQQLGELNFNYKSLRLQLETLETSVNCRHCVAEENRTSHSMDTNEVLRD